MRMNREPQPRREEGGASQGLCDRDFEKFSRIIFDVSGIALTDSKKELLRARLGKIMRRRGIPSFRDYLALVEGDSSGNEVVFMLDAISTNVTSFFRESDHFRFMEDVVLPGIAGKADKTGGKRLRAWCAGCSSGEEPYSLAITISEFITSNAKWDARILATDISTKVIKAAREGVYARPKLKDIPPNLVSRYFSRETGEEGLDLYRVVPGVRSIISFARLNLIGQYPFKGPFDVIFCRNVMIYFDKKTQEALVNRFHGYLDAGGHLFIGHSESLNGIAHQFQYVKPSVYRKKGNPLANEERGS
jgi:chemotaxis protein methyltransferase CheR